MKIQKKRHNKIGMILILVICLFLLFVLAGVVLNNKKNDLRVEGIALYEQGKYDAALSKLDEGLSLWAPFSQVQDKDIMLYKGSCYLLQGNFLGARNVYTALAADEKAEERIETYQQISNGLQVYAEGDYATAAELLTPYAKAGCYALYLYIGSSYLELGDSEQMLSAFEAYTGKGPDSSFLHGEMAAYYIESGQYEAAMTQIASGLAIGAGYERELRWQEVCCLEFMLDFNSAYEKMKAFALDYSLSEEELKEWNFLQTRYTGEDAAEGADTNAVVEFQDDGTE